MASRKWTESDKKTMMDYYRIGESIEDISKKLDRTPKAIVRQINLIQNKTKEENKSNPVVKALEQITELQNYCKIERIDPNTITEEDMYEFLLNPMSKDNCVTLNEISYVTSRVICDKLEEIKKILNEE